MRKRLGKYCIPDKKTTLGDDKKQMTWKELASRNIKCIKETTLEVEGIISGIRLIAKKKTKHSNDSVWKQHGDPIVRKDKRPINDDEERKEPNYVSRATQLIHQV